MFYRCSTLISMRQCQRQLTRRTFQLEEAARGAGRARVGRGRGAGVGRARGRGGPRARGAGRKRGFAQALVTRARIAAGVRRTQAKRMARHCDRLEATLCPDTARSICATFAAHGDDSKHAARSFLLAGGAVQAQQLTKRIRDKKIKPRRDTAIISHARGQCKGIVNYMADEHTIGMTAVSVHDDANMFVRKPKRPEDLVKNAFGTASSERLAKKMRIRGVKLAYAST